MSSLFQKFSKLYVIIKFYMLILQGLHLASWGIKHLALQIWLHQRCVCTYSSIHMWGQSHIYPYNHKNMDLNCNNQSKLIDHLAFSTFVFWAFFNYCVLGLCRRLTANACLFWGQRSRYDNISSIQQYPLLITSMNHLIIITSVKPITSLQDTWVCIAVNLWTREVRPLQNIKSFSEHVAISVSCHKAIPQNTFSRNLNKPKESWWGSWTRQPCLVNLRWKLSSFCCQGVFFPIKMHV